jgi:hypothetical protein
MGEKDREDVSAADEPLHSDEGDLTPPQGDALRSEETFGRTDRYSNIDDSDAARERSPMQPAIPRRPGSSARR